jgi:hypothetical protein
MTGPTKAVATKQSSEIPRLTTVFHTSVRAPPVTAIDDAPKAPLKKREIKIV